MLGNLVIHGKNPARGEAEEEVTVHALRGPADLTGDK